MVSANFDFIYESLKSKFSLIPLVHILTFGCSKKNKENDMRKTLVLLKKGKRNLD